MMASSAVDTTAAVAASDVVQARYTYVHPHESGKDKVRYLSFSKGDVLYILNRNHKDWWMARDKDDHVGYVAKNYVVSMEATTSPPLLTSIMKDDCVNGSNGNTNVSSIIKDDADIDDASKIVGDTTASNDIKQCSVSSSSSKTLLVLFNYEKRGKRDLALSKGELLTLIGGEDKSWLTAQNVAGQICLVPNNHVRVLTDAEIPVMTDKLKLDTRLTYVSSPHLTLHIMEEPWFAGIIGRSEAEVLLTEQPGSFLVRSSKSGLFSLSLRTLDGSIKHLKIYPENDMKFSLRLDEKMFITLNLLVEHYSSNNITHEWGRLLHSNGRTTLPAGLMSPPTEPCIRANEMSTQNGADIYRQDTSSQSVGDTVDKIKAMDESLVAVIPNLSEEILTQSDGVTSKNENVVDAVVIEGTRIIRAVREKTGLSFDKSATAVATVFEFLYDLVPELSSTLEVTLTDSDGGDDSVDRRRIDLIFSEIKFACDDGEQRNWSIYDDSSIIREYLEELMLLLEQAERNVCLASIREDNYERILPLLLYSQMETRTPIRVLLLRSLCVLGGLDAHIFSMILSSNLIIELARDVTETRDERERVLYILRTLMLSLSTGEQVPVVLYDYMNLSFFHIILDTIETPLMFDESHDIVNAGISLLLAFNLHYTVPTGPFDPNPPNNVVMTALKERKTCKHLSESVLLMANRNSDPVPPLAAGSRVDGGPRAPSLLKFLRDLFFRHETASLFYTNDLRVLIDFTLRELTDLCRGNPMRRLHMDVLHGIFANTDYEEHLYRVDELRICLLRIIDEHLEIVEDHEDEISLRDLASSLIERWIPQLA